MMGDWNRISEICKQYAEKYGESFVIEVFKYCLGKLERIGKQMDYLPILLEDELPQHVQMMAITSVHYPNFYSSEVFEYEPI